MQFKLIRILVLGLVSILLASCGDLFMKKKEESSVGNQFLTCSLDAKALSNIFTHNIKGELLCLKENLNLFVDVVKTDRPGNLSLKELTIYIKRNVEDIDASTLEALGGIFEINALMFGDHPQYIARHNVGKLVDLFIEINRVVVANHVYDYFTNDDQVDYREHNRRKALVYEAMNFIGRQISDLTTENNQSIDFVSFLEKFKNLDDNTVLKNCTKLLFLKRIFLGGSEELLTSKELRRLAKMIPDISKVAFDMAHISDIEHKGDEAEDIIQTLRINAEVTVKNLYFSGQEYTTVMTLTNIYDMIDIFFPEYKNWKRYTAEFLKAKKALLENDRPEFNSNELHILLKDILLNNLSRGVFIYRAFSMNKEFLSNPDMITEDLPNMINLENQEEIFKEDVNRIIQSYRFFKGSALSAKFENNISRNPLGVFEISILEDILKRVLAVYGTMSSNSRGGYHINQDQLNSLFDKYKEILITEGFFEAGRISDTAETITLLAGLFQSQSNGDGDLEVNELAEFALELLSAGNIGNLAAEYIENKCALDAKGRFMPECFREHFMETFELQKDDTKVKDQLPKLYDYLSTLDNEQVKDYAAIAEGFSRTCNVYEDGTIVPMKGSEINTVLTGMLAVEQTMVRFDINNDNVLQPDEVLESFKIYKGAVEALIPVGFLKSLSKTFYLYLMKYKKLPDVQSIKSLGDMWRAVKEGAHFAKFWLSSKKNKESDADRFTIATILKVISDMSEAEKKKELEKTDPLPGEIRFTCESMR